MYDIFSLKDYTFPKGFLWGSSVAGHQIEGDNINSQWWNMEQNYPKGDPTHVPSGKACNHYNMVSTDVDLIGSLGHKIFRTSVEWSRIEPNEGKFSLEATRHYVEEFALLKEKGIQVFVTLVHFTTPLWFEKLGGFKTLSNLKYFEKFVNYIVPLISPYVDYFNVLNEFNLGNDEERIQHKLNSLIYHARGYHIIKSYTSVPVSSAHALVQYMPLRPYDSADNIMRDITDFKDNEFFFHAIRTGEILYPYRDGLFNSEVKGSIDYWSINCYTRKMVDARREDARGKRYNHKELKMIPMDFYLEEMYPEGILANMTRLIDKPSIISENGCSADDDRFRIVYIATYLSALCEAIELGADVRGYLYWSLMDNYEWGSFIPKFGLCEVNKETFVRTPKPSASFYHDIIDNNGFNQEILRKYLTEMPSLIKK